MQPTGPTDFVHLHGPACSIAQTQRVRRQRAVSLLGALAAMTAVVLVRNPLKATVFPPCPLHAMTGLWCPGCGATRASYLLLHGDIPAALHFNAVWVVLAPFVLYQALAFGGEAFGVRGLRRIPLPQPLIVGVLGAIVAFFIVRNLPFQVFEVLNPTTSS